MEYLLYGMLDDRGNIVVGVGAGKKEDGRERRGRESTGEGKSDREPHSSLASPRSSRVSEFTPDLGSAACRDHAIRRIRNAARYAGHRSTIQAPAGWMSSIQGEKEGRSVGVFRASRSHVFTANDWTWKQWLTARLAGRRDEMSITHK